MDIESYNLSTDGINLIPSYHNRTEITPEPAYIHPDDDETSDPDNAPDALAADSAATSTADACDPGRYAPDHGDRLNRPAAKRHRYLLAEFRLPDAVPAHDQAITEMTEAVIHLLRCAEQLGMSEEMLERMANGICYQTNRLHQRAQDNIDMLATQIQSMLRQRGAHHDPNGENDERLIQVQDQIGQAEVDERVAVHALEATMRGYLHMTDMVWRPNPGQSVMGVTAAQYDSAHYSHDRKLARKEWVSDKFVVVVTGDKLADSGPLWKILDKIYQQKGGNIDLWHGGYDAGADAQARAWCWKRGVRQIPWPPKWELHGKGAGYQRNQLIADNLKGLDAGLIIVGNGPQSRDLLVKAARAGHDKAVRLTADGRRIQ